MTALERKARLAQAILERYKPAAGHVYACDLLPGQTVRLKGHSQPFEIRAVNRDPQTVFAWLGLGDAEVLAELAPMESVPLAVPSRLATTTTQIRQILDAIDERGHRHARQ